MAQQEFNADASLPGIDKVLASLAETPFWDMGKLWLAYVEKFWGSQYWSQSSDYISDAEHTNTQGPFGERWTMWNADGSHAGYVLSDIGDDWFNGSEADEVVLGLYGNDFLFGEGGADLLDGGSGDDSLSGGVGHDLLLGDSGSDWLFGDAGNDRLFGGNHGDYLTGGSGYDLLDGGDGIDTYFSDFGSAATSNGEIISLVTGFVRDFAGHVDRLVSIENASGSNNDDVIIGGAGSNLLVGNAGNDEIFGGDGDDTIFGEANQLFSLGEFDRAEGGGGNDTINAYQMHGGSGFDTFVFTDRNLQLVEDFTSGEDRLDFRYYTESRTTLSAMAPHLIDPSLSNLIAAGLETAEGLMLTVNWVDWFGDLRVTQVLLEGIGRDGVSVGDFIV